YTCGALATTRQMINFRLAQTKRAWSPGPVATQLRLRLCIRKAPRALPTRPETEKWMPGTQHEDMGGGSQMSRRVRLYRLLRLLQRLIGCVDFLLALGCKGLNSAVGEPSCRCR